MKYDLISSHRDKHKTNKDIMSKKNYTAGELLGEQKVSHVEGDPYSGLTKREYFAAKAMQGLCGMKPTNDERDIDKLTVLAVKIADALLTQLSKQQ